MQTQVGGVGYRNRRTPKRSNHSLFTHFIVVATWLYMIWCDNYLHPLPFFLSLSTFQHSLSFSRVSQFPQISRLGFLSQTLTPFIKVPIFPRNFRSTFPYSPSTLDPNRYFFFDFRFTTIIFFPCIASQVAREGISKLRKEKKKDETCFLRKPGFRRASIRRGEALQKIRQSW